MNRNVNKKRRENKEEIEEDTTKYGEFISSYFAWISPEEQKERAKKLQDITKK
jgi:formiminotetrahydrofolate cyclodeaminase